MTREGGDSSCLEVPQLSTGPVLPTQGGWLTSTERTAVQKRVKNVLQILL